MTLEALIFVIFGHFIGDFALQSEWIAKNKGRYWYVLLSHGMIWTGIISWTLLFFGIFALWKPVFLLIGHILMDKWKTTKPSDTWWYIYPDQLWHIIQCLIVSLF